MASSQPSWVYIARLCAATYLVGILTNSPGMIDRVGGFLNDESSPDQPDWIRIQ